MKQTAVEWLEQKLIEVYNFKVGECYEIEQAKKMEDDYAIEFADWLIKRQTNYFESLKELLETFKKTKYDTKRKSN